MRSLLLLVATSVAISTAGAQVDTRTDSQACADSNVTGLYRRCALWLDGYRLRRGPDGVQVGRPGFFRPLPLTRLVAGDSAQAYARRYERRQSQAMVLNLIGAAMVGVSAGLADRHHNCYNGPYGPCSRVYEDQSIGFLLGGVAASTAGLIIQVKSGKLAARSVWWHNERFAR